jgi:hypothetical protein
MNLQEFLDSGQRNAWVKEKNGLHIYVRRAQRLIGESSEKTLDLANISLPGSKKGKGVFTAWLRDYLEPLAASLGLTVYVESLQNTDLYKFLIRNGYTLSPDLYNPVPSVFKRPKEEPHDLSPCVPL